MSSLISILFPFQRVSLYSAPLYYPNLTNPLIFVLFYSLLEFLSSSFTYLWSPLCHYNHHSASTCNSWAFFAHSLSSFLSCFSRLSLLPSLHFPFLPTLCLGWLCIGTSQCVWRKYLILAFLIYIMTTNFNLYFTNFDSPSSFPVLFLKNIPLIHSPFYLNIQHLFF